MRRRWKVAAGLVGAMGVGEVVNGSWLAPRPDHAARWLAHRGVAQTFSLEGVDDQTCTATRIEPPTHAYLENTLPSMTAAFAAGADRVELDLHLTADHQLAVFHDATLDCRTDGHGAPEDHTMADLRQLDLGYGYTADGGQTYPLRGTAVGAMPTLDEVLATFPDRALLLHLKTDDPALGDRVADRLQGLTTDQRARLWVYGGTDAVDRVRERLPDQRTFDARQLEWCLGSYALAGWTGWMPGSCRRTAVLVPVSHAGWLWGWPRRFERRMEAAGTEVVLVGPWAGGHNTSGIDDSDALGRVPLDFGGWIWTNKIERLRGTSPPAGR